MIHEILASRTAGMKAMPCRRCRRARIACLVLTSCPVQSAGVRRPLCGQKPPCPPSRRMIRSWRIPI